MALWMNLSQKIPNKYRYNFTSRCFDGPSRPYQTINIFQFVDFLKDSSKVPCQELSRERRKKSEASFYRTLYEPLLKSANWNMLIVWYVREGPSKHLLVKL